MQAEGKTQTPILSKSVKLQLMGIKFGNLSETTLGLDFSFTYARMGALGNALEFFINSTSKKSEDALEDAILLYKYIYLALKDVKRPIKTYSKFLEKFKEAQSDNLWLEILQKNWLKDFLLPSYTVEDIKRIKEELGKRLITETRELKYKPNPDSANRLRKGP